MSQERKPRNSRQFILNRLVRILPVYLLGLFLGIIAELIIEGEFYSWSNLWASLFFVSTLQGYIGNPLEYSAVIWSLSFEMFFYVVYALTIGKNQKLFLLIWLVFALLAIPIHMLINIDHGILNYMVAMFAYSFIWLIGYFAFQFRNKWNIHHFSLMLSIGGLPLISRLQITDQYYDVLKYVLFALYSLPMFLYFLRGNNTKNQKWLLPAQCIFLVVSTLHLILHSNSLLVSKLIYIVLPVVLLIAAFKYEWVVQIFKPIRSVFMHIGDFSYALYILHYPLLFLLAYWLRDQLIWVPLISLCIFVLSYLLDVKIQPKIYQFFRKTA